MREFAGKGPHIASGHEVLSCAAQDDDPQRVVGGDFRRARDERVDHREVERIENLRPVERKRRNDAIALQEDGLAHDFLPLRECGLQIESITRRRTA
jgi:hypothetical protein